QLRRGVRTEHFLDEAIDLRIAKSIDRRRAHLLLRQTLAQKSRGIRVIENVPASLQLHLELRDRQRPSAQRLHQPALEIEEPQQPTRILLHRELAAERT